MRDTGLSGYTEAPGERGVSSEAHADSEFQNGKLQEKETGRGSERKLRERMVCMTTAPAQNSSAMLLSPEEEGRTRLLTILRLLPTRP